MKMIHVVGDSKWGGGGTIILALADMARGLGWEVDFLTTDPICRQMAAAHGLGIIDLDVIWRDIRPLRDLRGLYRLYRFFKTHRYQLVHTHTSKAGVVGRIAARLAGVPAVLHTAHAFPFHEESGFPSRTIYRLIETFAGYFCDRIVTVSNYHRQWGLQLRIAKPSRLIAIPNGVSESNVAVRKIPSRVRAELGIAPEDWFLFTPGRLSEGKGLEYLIDAIPQLVRMTVKRFTLVLAGDGPLRTALERKAADSGYPDRIRFVGFRRDIGDLLNASDIVVLPSLHEGLSISLLEAMAVGKPIVATAIGGNLEPTGNGSAAMIVTPKDAAALAEAIITLINNPALAIEKGNKARELYLRHHTLERMVDGYRRVYQDLALNAHAPRPLRDEHAVVSGNRL